MIKIKNKELKKPIFQGGMGKSFWAGWCSRKGRRSRHDISSADWIFRS